MKDCGLLLVQKSMQDIKGYNVEDRGRMFTLSVPVITKGTVPFLLISFSDSALPLNRERV